MLHYLASIDWTVNPVAISFKGTPIVMWYGISWVVGIALGSFFVYKAFRSDNRSQAFFDSFFLYIVISLVLGARLGHCLFYDPIQYLSSPIEILKLREGGMASHGASIGMLIGVCLFSLKQTNKKVNFMYLSLWMIAGAFVAWILFLLSNISNYINGVPSDGSVMLGSIFLGIAIGACIYFIYIASPFCLQMLDRLIIGVCIGASFIRIGNLMNSEIYGRHTNLPWGFNFHNDVSWVKAGSLPSHPTQIYEALIYFTLFLISLFLFWKTNAKFKSGRIIGVCLIGIFGSRFLIESIKNVQVAFEQDMFINMGQLLSIPFIIWGVILIVNSNKYKLAD